MKIRDKLNELSEELISRFRVIEARVGQLLEYSQAGRHMMFTPHGLSHISRVEQSYDWLLSDDDIENLNASELFCLLVATVLHDLLMIPRSPGDEERARENHATTIEDFIIQNKEDLPISTHEAGAIGQIVKGHAVWDLEDIEDSIVLGQDYVNLRKLAACLSIADICHADDSRAPMIVYHYLTFDDESVNHWKRHLQIAGITRRNDMIVMSALAFSDDGEQAVKEYKEAICKQLQIVSPYFRSELNPISDVELKLRRRESPIEQSLSFETNMSAILGVLIDGVYERSDVFVRELIQNALDAGYVQTARSMRRNEPYRPRIVITSYKRLGSIVALRIDDNGVGMDISDVKDTLLLIGGSTASKDSVKKLLESTTHKNLIATFGIGLLSCFKVAKKITIRTAKNGATPIELNATSIIDPIQTYESQDSDRGTTVCVELKDEYKKDFSAEESIENYCRMVSQADIFSLDLEWDEETLAYDRKMIMRLSHSDALPIHTEDLSKNVAATKFHGQDFFGWLWLSSTNPEKLNSDDGSIEILNDGIYVCNDAASDWLPKNLSMCDGVINFAAGAIDLPASRDRVVVNDKVKKKKREIKRKANKLFSSVSQISHDKPKKRNAAALILSKMSHLSYDERESIIREIDSLNVVQAGNKGQSTLGEIVADRPTKVYLEYEEGRWVSDLVEFDGKMLFHKPYDKTKLQSALLSQDGELVIRCSRNDAGDFKVLEAELLKSYFKYHGISTIDLTKETPKEGSLRSRPIPRELRNRIGAYVKFVEIPSMPRKRSWRIGRETWINIAHPAIGRVYRRFRDGQNDANTLRLGTLLIRLLSFELDEAVEEIIEWIPELDKSE